MRFLHQWNIFAVKICKSVQEWLSFPLFQCLTRWCSNVKLKNFCSCSSEKVRVTANGFLECWSVSTRSSAKCTNSWFLPVAATCFMFLIECADISHFITEPLLLAVYFREQAAVSARPGIMGPLLHTEKRAFYIFPFVVSHSRDW